MPRRVLRDGLAGRRIRRILWYSLIFMKENYKEMRTFIYIGVILFLMFLFSNFQDFLILIG